MWLDGRDRDQRKRVMTMITMMILAIEGAECRREQERGKALRGGHADCEDLRGRIETQRFASLGQWM